jgi:UDP-glucose:(heptosyl)LPS alpha-1,3-glucosyltransferase
MFYWRRPVLKNNPADAIATRNLKPKLSIALVVLECHRYGGQDQYVFELAEHFAAAGHDVHLYCYALRSQFATTVTVHQVPTWGRLMLLKFVSFFICASWQIWRAAKHYDIVHAAGGNIWGANVVTAHYCHPVAQQVAQNTLATGGVKVSFGRRIYDYLTFIVADALDRLVYQCRRQTTIIAVSQATKKDLMQAYRLPDKQFAVVYNGVNLTRFAPSSRANWRTQLRATYHLDDQTPVLLFVGTFARKGLSVLLDALAQLPVTSPVKLWVIGSGPPAIWQQRAAACNVADRVIWVGESTAVEKFYAAADIFVLPTLYEPFGLVIAEAMASGLPVITSRQAGAAELITHQSDGWLLDDPQDSKALAQAIQHLLNNRAVTQLMGQQAHQKIIDHHWAAVAERTLAVYYLWYSQRSCRKSAAHRRSIPKLLRFFTSLERNGIWLIYKS